MKKKYKTARKYSCPFCDKKMYRSDLIAHVQDEHEIMIPEEYSATRVVYDHINKKNYGTCMVCGAKVYDWDENICRYKNLCHNPKCRESVQIKARMNHLEDPEIQKKMLEGRRISGKYTFSDGITHSYTGSYEKKCWEFMDTVLHIPGKDLMIPGPVIDYEYNGETHKWILDCLYIPAMLAMDIKDGGNNPNTRPMESYREKQLAKEESIMKQSKYNYLRLTDNNFAQLLYALADIKFGVMEADPDKGIYINESASCTAGVMVGTMSSGSYIIPYNMKNTFVNDEPEHFAFGSIGSRKIYYTNPDNEDDIIEEDVEIFKEKFDTQRIIYSKKDINLSELNEISEAAFLENLLGFKYTSFQDFIYPKDMFIVEDVGIDKFYENAIKQEAKALSGTILESTLVKTSGYVSIMMDMDGSYYLTTPEDYLLVSPKYSSLTDITDTDIKLLNDLYEHNHNKRGEQDD